MGAPGQLARLLVVLVRFGLAIPLALTALWCTVAGGSRLAVLLGFGYQDGSHYPVRAGGWQLPHGTRSSAYLRLPRCEHRTTPASWPPCR